MKLPAWRPVVDIMCVWGVHNFHFQGVIPNHSALQSIHNFPTSPVFRSRSLKLRLHYLWTNNKPYLIFSPSMEVVLTFLYKRSPQRHATVGWSTKASYVDWRCWGDDENYVCSATDMRLLGTAQTLRGLTMLLEQLNILAICFCW